MKTKNTQFIYEKIETFCKKNGLVFCNKSVIEQAFIHRSYINENPRTGKSHNERLEFLGDAVLELVTTEYLYKKYPHAPEGELTAYRSALVNAQIVGEVGIVLGMNDCLFLSKGEARDVGTRARHIILANTYEAVVGAIYIDQGYKRAQDFIEHTLMPATEEIVSKKLWRDAKSWVQEKCQEIYQVTPTYKLVDAVGPDHDKEFIMAIFFNEKEIARGQGKSKQDAEQRAAREALEKEKWV
jgi:ribonuclease III